MFTCNTAEIEKSKAIASESLQGTQTALVSPMSSEAYIFFTHSRNLSFTLGSTGMDFKSSTFNTTVCCFPFYLSVMDLMDRPQNNFLNVFAKRLCTKELMIVA